MPPPVTTVSAGTTTPHPRPPAAVSSAASPSRRQLLLLSTFPLLLIPPTTSTAAASAPAAAYDPTTESERAASAALSLRVGEAVRLLDLGRDLQARGDFPSALASFTAVVRGYKDLALSEYARVGRALVLYEIGDRDESIAEMEDVSVALKGYPEIHAALAAALYADKHAPLLAENQFAIATLLDPHYTDLAYVRDTKHWPPSLVSSLRNFITLS